MTTIPVLDIAPLRAGEPGARERLAEELRRAFTEVGFYFVRGHGIPDAAIERTFDAARRFHDLPDDRKLAIRIDEHNIGYMPMRGNSTRVNAVGGPTLPNLNEAIFFKRELPADHPDVRAGLRFRGRNRWPEEADVPGFRAAVLDCCDAFERLGASLLPLYALALDRPVDFFAPYFLDPMYTLRLSHYPQQDPTAPENEYGIAPHLDTSFMTILAQNRIPGLSLRLPDGGWIDAPAPPGALLVNGGMMLRRWTNGRFLATPHRVVNRSGQERYAMPFFMDAGYRAVMTPLPRADGAGDLDQQAPITYADFMTGYQRGNFHHAAPPPEGQPRAVELQGA